MRTLAESHARLRDLHRETFRPINSTGEMRGGCEGSRNGHSSEHSERTQHNWTGVSSVSRRHSSCALPYVQSSFSRSFDSTSVNSTARRQDARDIFEEYGIAAPEGWLSEAGSGNDGNEAPRPPSEAQRYQICHSCRMPLPFGKHCPKCGHESCIKCTGEMPPDRFPLIPTPDDSRRPAPLFSPPAHHKTTRPSSQLPFTNPIRRSIHQSGRSDHSVSTAKPHPYMQLRPVLRRFQLSSGQQEAIFGQQNPPPTIRGILKNNPFVQADRDVKARPSKPQTSK